MSNCKFSSLYIIRKLCFMVVVSIYYWRVIKDTYTAFEILEICIINLFFQVCRAIKLKINIKSLLKTVRKHLRYQTFWKKNSIHTKIKKNKSNLLANYVTLWYIVLLLQSYETILWNYLWRIVNIIKFSSFYVYICTLVNRT